MNKKYIHDLSHEIIGCAIEVHRHLGPGLLESVYETCLIQELRSVGLNVKSQVYVPIVYKGMELGSSLKLDIVVNDVIVVENKAAEFMIPLYKAQLLSYLKLSNLPKGLLINFNCQNLKDQLISLVTEEYAKLPD